MPNPGFVGQNSAISSTTPTPLVASSGQVVNTGIRLQNLSSTIGVYFGFYATQALATTGLTTTSGYYLGPGAIESIDMGAMKLNSTDSQGNVVYLYLLAASGTGSVCFWGV